MNGANAASHRTISSRENCYFSHVATLDYCLNSDILTWEYFAVTEDLKSAHLRAVLMSICIVSNTDFIIVAKRSGHYEGCSVGRTPGELDQTSSNCDVFGQPSVANYNPPVDHCDDSRSTLFIVSKFFPHLPHDRMSDEAILYINNASSRNHINRQYLLCLRPTKVKLSSGQLGQLKNNGLHATEDSLEDKQYSDMQFVSSLVNDNFNNRHSCLQQKDVQRTIWSIRFWLTMQIYTKLDSLIPCRIFMS